MNIPRKTLENGFSMPVFGIGTWRMGGDMERNPDNDDASNIAAIERALDAGITHIDTAEMYAAGHAEKLVAKAIEGRARETLFLVSKVLPENLAYDDVLLAAEGSLKRLGTDYFDLYLIHKPNPRIDMEETLKAMTKLVDDGIARAIGVSNFSATRWEKAQSFTPHPLAVNQVHYSLQCREPETSGLIPYAENNDRLLTAWRPVMHLSETADTALLDRMCEKYGKTRAQIAINWLISQKRVVTVAKMTSESHLEENLGAIGWEMDNADIEVLRKRFPDQIRVSDAVPLA
jgi:diketogulonate reductase-like aldo/keto reductase